jgi:O-antigen/teichoic acid export membrane protein
VVGSLPFWAGGIFLTIYTYIDSVLLGAFDGTRAVGIYAPAVRMFSVGFFLPTIIGAAMLPVLSRLGTRGGEEFQRASRKTISLMVLSAVPLTVGLCTFSGPLIVTVYGHAYRESVPVLAVLSLCLLPTFLNMQASQTLAAGNRQWRWTVALALSCVLNPVVNAALIPFAAHHWHNGALGAALALLITELGMAAYSVVLLRPILCTAEMYWTFGGAMAAGVMQTATLCLAAGLWPIAAEALGLMAFTLIAFLLGVLPLEDILLMLRTIGDLAGSGFRGRARVRPAEMRDTAASAQ